VERKFLGILCVVFGQVEGPRADTGVAPQIGTPMSQLARCAGSRNCPKEEAIGGADWAKPELNAF